MCWQSVTAAEAAAAAAANWFLASSALFGQNKIAASGTQCFASVAAASASADAAGCRLCDGGYLMRIERHFK